MAKQTEAQKKALQRANKLRRQQANVRGELRKGTKSPAHWLDREKVAAMLEDVTVVEFVSEYLPGGDEMAGRRVARAVGANQTETLGELTLHRRRALVNELERRPVIGVRRAEAAVRGRDHLPQAA